ncbi:hypothetical protein [Actinomadura flavalba]|uniref:hypothetical protein n=1 Tax=Actinomadura flavalba TaxID=1120938 RepID=UPI0012DCC7E0|nr:hypothetical protein [Actinomadura flavalba]
MASDELVVFREALVDRWPQVRDMMEPLEGDDDPDEIEAMGRYLILTLPFRLAELIPEMRDLAVGAAISGFDPQAEVAF